MKSVFTLLLCVIVSITLNAQITDTGGNVGIGTTSPISKLDVNGDIRSNSKYIITGKGAFDQQSTNVFFWANNSLLLCAGGGSSAQVTLLPNGNLGIGATTIDYKLTVAGGIGAREVTVNATMGADYVFNEEYNLRPLDEVEKYIKANKHLPGVASEKEMQTNGIELGEMNIKLLEKIEELTLYMIDLKKEVDKVTRENQTLKQEVSQFKKN